MVSLPRPTAGELGANSMATVMRYFIESLGIVGVNIFVLISGWFLINARAKSFLSLSFQILLLLGGIFLIMLFAGEAELSVKNISEVFLFTKWDWFVKAYIVLMIMAPVLNTFVQNSSEPIQRHVIIAFFVYESTYGWLGGANRFFVNGYGPLLFIGLYLLAQYAHHAIKELEYKTSIIGKLFNFKKKYDFLVFLGCTLINTSLCVVGLYLGVDIYSRIYAYTNPFTIIAALYLLLLFAKFDVKTNKIVNILAAGSFAVYLIHSQVEIRQLFNKGVQFLYTSFDGLTCILSLFVFLVSVYIVSVVIDYPRLWIWNRISNKFNIK